ncbi:hypothetical protein L195_g006377, partial [Trifolium pratense]
MTSNTTTAGSPTDLVKGHQYTPDTDIASAFI